MKNILEIRRELGISLMRCDIPFVRQYGATLANSANTKIMRNALEGLADDNMAKSEESVRKALRDTAAGREMSVEAVLKEIAPGLLGYQITDESNMEEIETAVATILAARLVHQGRENLSIKN